VSAATDEGAAKTVARLQVLAAALLFSTGGTVIKLTSLSAWQIASYRSGVAVLGVLVGLALTGRKMPRLTTKMGLIGLAYAVTLTLFVSANKLTTAASAILLQSTAPLYVLVLGAWLLRERIRRYDWLTLALMVGGLALFALASDPTAVTAPDPARGNALGLIAGVTWAITILGLRWLSSGEAGGDAGLAGVVAGNLLAFVLLLPWALPGPLPSGRDLGALLFLGLVQIALAYFFLIAGVRRLPAFEASLLLLIEPVASAVLAWLVHGERLSLVTLAGGALILAGTGAKAAFEAAPLRRARRVAGSP
jgi:drug/metabolite transporter, DME family